MKLHWPSIGEVIQAGWRPFTGYASAVGLVMGMFSPHVTVDKMGVIASLLGGLGFLRTSEKKAGVPPVLSQASPPPPDADTQ